MIRYTVDPGHFHLKRVEAQAQLEAMKLLGIMDDLANQVEVLSKRQDTLLEIIQRLTTEEELV